MEQDIITQDDVDEIGTALSLSPNASNVVFTDVVKSSTGDPLVSLDELYEKTGQESVNTIIRGFKLATLKHKLSQEHGKALKVVGAENWSPIPDEINYIVGKEGFFSTIRDSIVGFVKSVIKFIKGICNWIIERVRRLFGYEKTAKEVEYLSSNTKRINKAMTGMMIEMGAPKKEFDATDFYSTLPDNRTDVEQLTLIKNRADNAAEAIARIEKTLPAFNEALTVIEKLGNSTKKASDGYEREIRNLRKKFNAKDVTLADIVKFNLFIKTEIFVTLDYEPLASVLELLYKGFYGIEIQDLGVEGTMSKAREELKRYVSVTKQKLTPEDIKYIKNANLTISAAIHSAAPGKNSLANMKLTEKSFSKFGDLLKVNDAEFIREISGLFPNQTSELATRVHELPACYAAFVGKLREFTELVNASQQVVQEMSKSYLAIVAWHSKMTALVAAYLTRDVKRISEAHDKYLTAKEKDDVTTDGNPDYLFNLKADFDKKYPGLNLPEDFSRLMVALQEADAAVNNNRLNTFIETLKG